MGVDVELGRLIEATDIDVNLLMQAVGFDFELLMEGDEPRLEVDGVGQELITTTTDVGFVWEPLTEIVGFDRGSRRRRSGF